MRPATPATIRSTPRIFTRVIASMVTRFALMAHCEDLDTISPRVHAVQRDVPGATERDYRCARSTPHGPPDVRVALEDLHGVDDYGCRGTRHTRAPGSQEVEQPLDIGQGPRTV